MAGLASRFCTRFSGLAVLEMLPAGFDQGLSENRETGRNRTRQDSI